MIFSETRLAGVVVIDLEPRADERGFFARAWCADELGAQGLDSRLAQTNISFNERAGTIRGLHYQEAPHGEVKLMRCTRGAIFDVVIDLRPGSPTCLQWLGTELSAADRRALYVPEGVAHGYQALEDATEVLYGVSSSYRPEAERGIRWCDPAFAIAWPLTEAIVSEKDRSWPDYLPVPDVRESAPTNSGVTARARESVPTGSRGPRARGVPRRFRVPTVTAESIDCNAKERR